MPRRTPTRVIHGSLDGMQNIYVVRPIRDDRPPHGCLGCPGCVGTGVGTGTGGGTGGGSSSSSSTVAAVLPLSTKPIPIVGPGAGNHPLLARRTVRVACDRDWQPSKPPVITVPVTIKPARIVWGFQQAVEA